MKKLLPLLFLLIATAAYSQPAVITLKNGSKLDTNISALTSNEVYTADTRYYFDEIDGISFYQNNAKFRNIYKTLEDNGISVSFIEENDSMYPQNERNFKEKILQATETPDPLYVGLENFRRSYQTGTSLMAAGLGISIAAVLLSATGNIDAEATGILSAVSGLSFGTGIFVMAGAGKHLKNLR
jgi:hypothetical protein